MRVHNETETCETIQARLTALWDSELAPAEAANIRSHLAACPDCTLFYGQIEATLHAADAWKVDGTDVWQGLEKRLRQEPNTDRRLATPDPLPTQRTLTAEQLADALYVSRNTGGDLAKIIIDLGYAAERDVAEAKARAEHLPFIDLQKHKPEQSALSMLPRSFALKHNALPVKKDGTKLWVAMADPRDAAVVDEIRMISRCQIAPLLAVPADLEQAIAGAYFSKMPERAANADTQSQEDLQAVLTEMRALRAEIQDLRGEVGSLRRMLTATRQATPAKLHRPLSPPQLMPLALPENGGIGLL